jgi:hypothetical protein
MHFQAYIVKQNTSTSINISLVGIILFLLSIFGLAFESTEDVAMYFSIGGFFLIIGGAILGKGRGLFQHSTDVLSVDEKEITICGLSYPLQDVSKLSFYYHSFYSQSSYGYFYEPSGLIEDGMNNSISFIYNGQPVSTLFSLANIDQANMFFATVKYLQESGKIVHLQTRLGRR